eukprot:8972685-Pyramimonas_sp.AAC.1
MRPSSNNEGQFAEWVDVWTKKPGSPILDWPEAKCRSFLECCARGATTAKTIDFNFTTYKDLKP